MNEQQKKALFAKSYSELFDYLYRYVCYRVPQREEAEDLVSEIFLQGYHRLNDFHPEQGQLRQWMTGIAKNKLLMYWRRRPVQVDLDSIPEIPDLVQGTALQFLDQSMLVERLLSHVSEDLKSLIAFRYVDGLSHEEIAQMIGKQPAAVRKCFSRLHKQLQEIYQEHYA